VRALVLLILLVLELALFASVSGADVSTPGGIFDYLELKFQDLIPGLAPVLVLSVGMTLVLVTAGIDLSVGSMLALVAAVMSCFDGGMSFWLTAVPLGLLVGVGLGLFNGALVARLDVPPIVATLGTMIFYRGLCQVVMRDAERAPFFDVPGYEWLGGFSGSLVLLVLVVGLGGWCWSCSRWRRELLLVGGNRVAARYAGVPLDRRLLQTYALMGALAWLAAICFTARNGAVNASTASGLELKVIVAVVLGGTRVEGGRGSVLGSVLGAFLVAVLDDGLREAKGWSDEHLAFEISHLRYLLLGLLLVAGVWLNTRFGHRDST
jgi:ribose/xylose/arabinose/galactoside ABC-type transport system permease subunit